MKMNLQESINLLETINLNTLKVFEASMTQEYKALMKDGSKITITFRHLFASTRCEISIDDVVCISKTVASKNEFFSNLYYTLEMTILDMKEFDNSKVRKDAINKLELAIK